MRIIAIATLKRFFEEYPDTEEPLKAWIKCAREADWNNPADIKMMFGKASILQDNRVVFDIAGNKYRLIVKINYKYKVIYIRFIGSHTEYDKIDALSI